MHILLLLVLAFFPTALPAQQADRQGPLPQYLQDPYTKSEQAALLKNGITGLGKMYWADGHSTADVDENLGDVKVIWIETAHFRIGCSLPSYMIDKNSKHEKTKLKAELKKLVGVIPGVKAKTKTLDPWLRLHLFVARAEGLYAEMFQLLGLNESDFPTEAGQLVDGRYMGEGPFMGMTDKFTFMLFEKKSSLGRYRNGFLGISGSAPTRHMFVKDGSLLFAVAQETNGVSTDTSLHCMFTFNMTMNLLQGYRYYSRTLPSWMVVGLAHWNARRLDEKRNYFTEDRNFGADDKDVWNWGPRVRARVGHGIFPHFEELAAFSTPETMEYTQHMAAWTRVDFLMDTHPDGFRIWFDVMRDPYPSGIKVTEKMLFERQVEALNRAWGLSPAEFDAQWSNWAAKHYPKK